MPVWWLLLIVPGACGLGWVLGAATRSQNLWCEGYEAGLEEGKRLHWG
jgi:hypothetical protein